jgi:AAA family ATP:ADP antiporter
MSERRSVPFLRRVVDAGPGEARLVWTLALNFFLIMAAAYLLLVLKTARILSAERGGGLSALLQAYVLTAALMAVVGSVNSRLLQALRREVYISRSLFVFILSFVGFRFLFDTGWKHAPIVFWIWADVFLALSVTQFWLLVNDLLRPRQTKRFIGFFVGAGLLGGFFGSAVAWGMALLGQAKNLLLVCSGFLIVCRVLLAVEFKPSLVRREPGEEEARQDKPHLWAGFRAIAQNRYLLFLSAFMLAGFAVPRILDWQLNRALYAFFRDERAMMAYLGVFMMAILVAAYLIHILFTNRLLRKFSFRAALLMAPTILLGGAAAGMFISGTFWRTYAAILRGADKSMSFSLSQSTREILFIPVPPAVRVKAKVVIDLFISKFADVLAVGFILLVGGEGKILGIDYDHRLLVVLMGFLVAWIILGRRVVREYVEVVKSHLHLRWPEADKVVLDRIDLDATKLVFDTLESRSRSSVLFAMNLMDLIDKEKLSPELREIIAVRSAEIEAGSMDALLGLDGTSLLPEADDALDERVLSREVREILNLDVYQTLMERQVAETARETTASAETSQMEVAKALGMMRPDAPLVRELLPLLRHESPEVARYALESAGRLRRREFVPAIVPHLGRPATAAAAVEALAAYGDSIAGVLVDYLLDPGEPLSVRRSVPEVLVRTSSRRTARLLLAALGRDEALDGEVIEGLFRLRGRDPTLVFDEGVVRAHVFRLARAAAGLICAVADVQAGRSSAAEADLETALARRLKMLFELLSLAYSREDVLRAYQNYRKESRRSADYALELLEHVLPRDVRDAVLPLLEDQPLEDKARRLRRAVVE